MRVADCSTWCAQKGPRLGPEGSQTGATAENAPICDFVGKGSSQLLALHEGWGLASTAAGRPAAQFPGVSPQ